MDWTRRPQSKPAMQKMERKEIKDNDVQALRILKKKLEDDFERSDELLFTYVFVLMPTGKDQGRQTLLCRCKSLASLYVMGCIQASEPCLRDPSDRQPERSWYGRRRRRGGEEEKRGRGVKERCS